MNIWSYDILLPIHLFTYSTKALASLCAKFHVTYWGHKKQLSEKEVKGKVVVSIWELARDEIWSSKMDLALQGDQRQEEENPVLVPENSGS